MCGVVGGFTPFLPCDFGMTTPSGCPTGPPPLDPRADEDGLHAPEGEQGTLFSSQCKRWSGISITSELWASQNGNQGSASGGNLQGPGWGGAWEEAATTQGQCGARRSCQSWGKEQTWPRKGTPGKQVQLASAGPGLDPGAAGPTGQGPRA